MAKLGRTHLDRSCSIHGGKTVFGSAQETFVQSPGMTYPHLKKPWWWSKRFSRYELSLPKYTKHPRWLEITLSPKFIIRGVIVTEKLRRKFSQNRTCFEERVSKSQAKRWHSKQQTWELLADKQTLGCGSLLFHISWSQDILKMCHFSAALMVAQLLSNRKQHIQLEI